MAVQSVFDPKVNGWFFENWGETNPFSWALYRQTYLSINPTEDVIAAPLDVAFYEIFKKCAENGNCGGMCMLALSLFKFGGFMGFCSPANFYTGAGNGPDRADLHAAINIMQARQFSAPGIRNFLDVVKAGQLNDGVAAFARAKSGVASGDYCLLSLSNGLFGDAAHVVIPYAFDESMPGTKIMLVWDPNRPYDAFPEYYDLGRNRIVINGPTSWTYDQKGGGLYTTGETYLGSNAGWCFAIPTSLEMHKARQPISVGFILTGLTLLFVSGTGAAVTQIEDDEGRRFYATDRRHRRLGDMESAPSRRLQGVARWPWYGAERNEPLPGDLYVIDRPADAAALTVTVRAPEYRLIQADASNLLEIEATATTAGRDRVRVDSFAGTHQAVDLASDAADRVMSVRQLRREGRDRDWRSVHVRNARLTGDRVRIRTVDSLDAVEVVASTARTAFDVEFQRFRAGKLEGTQSRRHVATPDDAARLRPEDWDSIAGSEVVRGGRPRRRPAADRTQRAR